MNRLSAISVAVVATLIAAPAYAQDHDWSGFYIGGNVGYTVTDSNTEFVNPQLAAFTIPSDQSGFHGGLQVGANFQTGVIVLGVEAAASIGDIGATFDDPLSPPPDTVTAGSDYQAALLGRAGIGVGNLLPYVTAGVVAAHVHTSATAGGADDDGMFFGLGYGAGIEVALDDNWSIRGQYLHTDLSGENFNQGLGWETSSSLSSDTITFGVNYSF
jgi:outer membrane immunogenic protein